MTRIQGTNCNTKSKIKLNEVQLTVILKSNALLDGPASVIIAPRGPAEFIVGLHVTLYKGRIQVLVGYFNYTNKVEN